MFNSKVDWTQCRCRLFLFVCFCIAMHTSVFAQEFTFQVRSSPFKSLAKLNQHIQTYNPPVLVDRKGLETQIQRLQSGLQALSHMAQMIGEEHARQALKAQIEALKVSIAQLNQDLKNALIVERLKDVDSSKSKKTSSSSKSKKTPSKESKKAPLTAKQFKTYWAQLNRAEFSGEQMGVLRKVARHSTLTVKQALQFLSMLSFPSDRKEAVILLYDRLVDPENINQLYPLLTLSDQDAVEFHIRQTNRQHPQ